MAKSAVHKGVFLLPNLLTTASLFAGFLGMLWAIQGRFEMCAIAICVSALFDGLDGKVARLTNTASEFGVQFDSLADLVAFGVNPALMLYLWQLQDFGRLGMTAAFLFIACGAMRLARFNVQSSTASRKFFIGLPIPAAAGVLATLVFFSGYLPESLNTHMAKFCLVLVYALSFLMVSRVRFYSFKELGVIREHRFSALVTAMLIFVLVASEPKLLGFILAIGYIISGLIYTFIILPRRSHTALLREPNKLS